MTLGGWLILIPYNTYKYPTLYNVLDTNYTFLFALPLNNLLRIISHRWSSFYRSSPLLVASLLIPPSLFIFPPRSSSSLFIIPHRFSFFPPRSSSSLLALHSSLLTLYTPRSSSSLFIIPPRSSLLTLYHPSSLFTPSSFDMFALFGLYWIFIDCLTRGAPIINQRKGLQIVLTCKYLSCCRIRKNNITNYCNDSRLDPCRIYNHIQYLPHRKLKSYHMSQ